MKRDGLALFIIMLFSGNLFAQNDPYEKTFTGYADYTSKKFGINCNRLEKFTDLNQYYKMLKIREDRYVGFMYGPVFQAKDKGCIVMYPAFPWYISKEDVEMGKIAAMRTLKLNNDTSTVELQVGNNDTFPRDQVTGELKAAIGLFDYFGKPLHDSVSFDFNDHVTIVAGKKPMEMFNADTLFIYNIPLEKPYQCKYKYCTGVVISKKDRATMLFKYFFTWEGKKKEDEYINLLNKQVWYDEDFRYEEE